jgi:hypothetical protein
MCPVSVIEVPVNIIKDFIDVPEHKLEDNWYWCSSCGKHEQREIPVKPSPEAERALQTLSSFVSDW